MHVIELLQKSERLVQESYFLELLTAKASQFNKNEAQSEALCNEGGGVAERFEIWRSLVQIFHTR